MEDKKIKFLFGRRSPKNILVDSSMQNRFGLHIVAINFCIAGIGLVILLMQISKLRDVMAELPEIAPAASELLADALAGIVAIPFILLIVSAAVNYLAGLFISHRFAGPTKIIIEFIDNLIKKKPTGRRELRPNDELKSIMSKLHQLADQLEKKD